MQEILIIEQDDAIAEILLFCVEHIEFIPRHIKDTRYLDDINRENIALILVDHYYGSFAGDGLCRKLKKQKSSKHIPILFLSTHFRGEMIFKDSLADEYLEKPFELNELLTKIKSLTQNKLDRNIT